MRALTLGRGLLKWRDDAREDGELSDERALLRDMERSRPASVAAQRLVDTSARRSPRTTAGPAITASASSKRSRTPVTLARKILSCVARVGQRFGIAHVTNVLRGSDSDQVRRAATELTVFGLLKDATIDEIRGYIDQLLAHGLLQQGRRRVSDPAVHGRGLALLKDPAPCRICRWRAEAPRSRPPKRAGSRPKAGKASNSDLFEQLRALRLEIARRAACPYVIFHDTTLREIAPSSRSPWKSFGTSTASETARRRILGELVLAVVARS